MTSLASLARQLGGTVTSRNSILIPTPGHGREDRGTSVTFDPAAPGGFLVHSFNGGDELAIKDMVAAALGLPRFEASQQRERDEIRHRVAFRAEPDATAVKRSEFAASLWAEAKPIGGTIAETYLNARRIAIPFCLYSGDAIRFLAACPFKLNSGEVVRLPAMLAAMVAIKGSEFQGISRTALLPDGSGKVKMRGMPDDGRMMLGSAKGAVVKLSADDDVTLGLHLAEGVETALSCMTMGFAPIWATLSAGTLEKFPALPGVEHLTIFADNDESGTGSDAARECAERWADAGAEVTVNTPPVMDTDFNDILEGSAA